MSHLLLSRQSHFSHFRRHISPMPIRIGKHFLMFVMILMVGVMSLLYLMHFTDVHTKGYVLRKLEKEREDLQVVQGMKQMNLTRVKSLSHIQNSSKVSRMIPARNPMYLKLDTEVAQR